MKSFGLGTFRNRKGGTACRETSRPEETSMLNINPNNGSSKEPLTALSHGAFAKKLRWMIQDAPDKAEKWTITPDMASGMLEWNDRNRPLTRATTKEYAALMTADRWMFTGEPIIFSDQRLIDGQHRLAAVVASGKSIEALVVFGAPDEAFSKIDVGKTRTAGDIFAINGVKYPNNISAAAKWVWMYEAHLAPHFGGQHKVDHAALYSFYLKHKGLDDSTWIASVFQTSRLAPPSLMMAIHYVCARKARKSADEFFSRVGEGIGFISKKDPAYKLHKRLIDNAVNQEKMGRVQMSALTIKAWNAHRLGRDVGALKFGADEPFPKVI